MEQPGPPEGSDGSVPTVRPERSISIPRLVGIPLAVAVVAVSVFAIGVALDNGLIRYMGLMIGATTFVPLPADTFVLAAAADNNPIAVGVVGGLLNMTMVLVERAWILTFVDSPWFDRLRRFFDTNKVVAMTERNMFAALIFGGATFIPFEPFRLLAVVRNYSPVRYAAATFISRGGRYLVLAAIGTALLEVGVLRQAIWVTVALFVIGLWRTAVRLIQGTRDQAEEAGEGS